MSSQSLIGYTILIAFGAMIWGVSGYLVTVVIIPWGGNFLAGYMQSQDSMNTASLILQISLASPLFMLLLWGYDHIVNSFNTTTGDQ